MIKVYTPDGSNLHGRRAAIINCILVKVTTAPPRAWDGCALDLPVSECALLRRRWRAHLSNQKSPTSLGSPALLTIFSCPDAVFRVPQTPIAAHAILPKKPKILRSHVNFNAHLKSHHKDALAGPLMACRMCYESSQSLMTDVIYTSYFVPFARTHTCLSSVEGS